jgi:hypothetical protein
MTRIFSMVISTAPYHGIDLRQDRVDLLLRAHDLDGHAGVRSAGTRFVASSPFSPASGSRWRGMKLPTVPASTMPIT